MIKMCVMQCYAGCVGGEDGVLVGVGEEGLEVLVCFEVGMGEEGIKKKGRGAVG